MDKFFLYQILCLPQPPNLGKISWTRRPTSIALHDAVLVCYRRYATSK